MDIHNASPFSALAASVTAVGQLAFFPADWGEGVKAAVAFVASVGVGFTAPLVRDAVRQAVQEIVGRKQAEAERDEARKQAADSQAELQRLLDDMITQNQRKNSDGR